MNTFEQFAKSTIKASKILNENDVERLLATPGKGGSDPLYKYAYRIAAFVTLYCRAKVPMQVDDTDWQDAVQECMVKFPTVLASYTRAEAPFLRYMSKAFQQIICRYLWNVVKGGTGSADTEALPTISFEEYLTADRNIFDDELANEYYENIGESTAFGTRDPLTEAMAYDTACNLMQIAANDPTPWTRGKLSMRTRLERA